MSINKEGLKAIIERIKDPVLLFLLGYAIISISVGVYDFQKLVQLQLMLALIFLGGLAYFIANIWIRYKQPVLTRQLEQERDRYKACLEELQIKFNQEKPTEGLERDLDVMSIDLDLVTPDAAIDSDNHYTSVVFYAEIDEAGNYAAHYERHGVRITNGITRHLIIRTGASAAVRFKQLNMKAIDLKSGKPLNIEVVEDDLPYVKVYKIELIKPAKRLEDFAVVWTFTWPHCVGLPRDTDAINLKVFGQGVGHLKYTLVFPFEPYNSVLYEVKNRRAEPSQIQPKPRQEGSKYFIEYEPENPQADGLVIAWSRPPLLSG